MNIVKVTSSEINAPLPEWSYGGSKELTEENKLVDKSGKFMGADSRKVILNDTLRKIEVFSKARS